MKPSPGPAPQPAPDLGEALWFVAEVWKTLEDDAAAHVLVFAPVTLFRGPFAGYSFAAEYAAELRERSGPDLAAVKLVRPAAIPSWYFDV